MSSYYAPTAPGAVSGRGLARRPDDPVAHYLRVEDPRCGCGLPREECVRRRIRALWTGPS
jgi:hypothetical protein